MTEYEVREKGEGTRPFWYRHGYQGTDEHGALNSLSHMRETYGRYGRSFAIFSREVSEWQNTEGDR